MPKSGENSIRGKVETASLVRSDLVELLFTVVLGQLPSSELRSECLCEHYQWCSGHESVNGLVLQLMRTEEDTHASH